MRKRLLYFAYGSNLWPPRLAARTPSCRTVAKGHIEGFQLRFHKLGKDGSAKCDAYFTGSLDDRVEGVVYEFASSERGALDRAEDLGIGYRDEQVSVVVDNGAVEALTYHAYESVLRDDILPFDWYYGFVRAGAQYHGLPESYISWLQGQPVMLDEDRARHALNNAILNTSPD